MNDRTAVTPDYGNWVSTKLIYGPAAMTIPFLVLSLVFPILVIGAIAFGLAVGYFAYARNKFSQRGGNLQARIRNLVIDHLTWKGEGSMLDIGCGNAPLTIELAKRYPKARVTGIDYWGGTWEYSKVTCEKNAGIEGVASRTTFKKGSASALPFEDECFDAVVSNLVFHEVGGVKDKTELIKEALRVVKKGGAFSFQDLFLLRGQFGEVNDLVVIVKRWGTKEVSFVNTSGSEFIPKALKLPFMLGKIAIICGTK
jgi:ubiquinone/menaquinone biosynthesis C-methylase UbiE